MMLLIQHPEWRERRIDYRRRRQCDRRGRRRRRKERRIKTRWAFRGLTWTQRGFKGVLDVDVAEARKARQLGGTAGCQNLCPLPLSLPNQTTTSLHAHTSFFSSTTSSAGSSPSRETSLHLLGNIFDELNHDIINEFSITFDNTFAF